MTGRQAGQLRIGDFVCFDGQMHEIAGIEGSTVILLADSGRRVVVKSGVLLSDATCEIISSHRRRRPLPSVPSTLCLSHSPKLCSPGRLNAYMAYTANRGARCCCRGDCHWLKSGFSILRALHTAVDRPCRRFRGDDCIWRPVRRAPGRRI